MLIGSIIRAVIVILTGRAKSSLARFRLARHDQIPKCEDSAPTGGRAYPKTITFRSLVFNEKRIEGIRDFDCPEICEMCNLLSSPQVEYPNINYGERKIEGHTN